MRTSSVGRIISARSTAGVTLIEMMIVMTMIAIVAGVSYPAVSSGLETLRLRSAADSIAGLLNTSLERADRRQQAVEIQIFPKQGVLIARSADLGFTRQIQMPEFLHISDVLPHVAVSSEEMRRVIVYPGGAPPPVGIEISTLQGRKRMVRIDPITGVPQSQ